MMIGTIAAQIPVTLDPERNRRAIVAAVETAPAGSIVVCPEGALSGYGEDLSFLDRIDRASLLAAIESLRVTATRRGLHLFFGTLLPEQGEWYNAAIYAGPHGEQGCYRKTNLATAERSRVTPGSALPLFELRTGGGTLKLGVQICRELRFPEGWRLLARAGAQAFAYLTHTLGDDARLPVWRSHLVSRAAENQRFVIAANAAGAARKCPSAIIGPDGIPLAEAAGAGEEILHATIETAAVSDWYIGQIRDDLSAPSRCS
jgi:predicted amidohydrolase